ncbi:MAG: hypothetical protein OXC69_04205 [Candidatus Tectomicrobia bacterium]|nr:hypothetical protein [Candidatus Tectomicrobia bacterium]
MIRRIPGLLSIVIVGLLMCHCLAMAQVTYDFDAAANDLAEQVAKHFPHLRGEVVDVQDSRLYLSLGARDQVLEGMRLNVFREGEALTSPTTGEVLGRLEEDLGTVTVTQVGETYAVATQDNPLDSGEVQAGDQVRITAGRLALALLPTSDETGGVLPLSALAAAINRGLYATGRFEVLPEARLVIWLLEHRLSHGDLLAPEIMTEAASALGVSYLARPVLRTVGDSTVVELRLYEPGGPQAPFNTAVAMLSESAPMPRQPVLPTATQPPGTVSPPPASPAATHVVPAPVERSTTLASLLSADSLALEKSYVPLAQFSTELRGFDAADIDGDGLSELVMLSDTKVFLYRVQENRLVPVSSYSDRRPGVLLSGQFVSLGNGQTPGVVVNRHNPQRKGMDSFLLLVEDDQLKLQQKSMRDIMLAVDTDGDGLNESVWGQGFDNEDFFRRGQVRQYEWQDGRLKRQRKLSLPVGFRATGAALARLGATPGRQLVFVDERHSLQVYDGKARRWKSTTEVGGGYVFALLDLQYSPRVSEQTQFDFEAIPAVADLDDDGIDEVLVPQNQSSFGMVPNLNLYSGGHVAIMRQTPQGFTLSPVSPGFDGVVSGVAVLKDSVRGILVAVSKWEGVLRQRKQTILYLNRL